MDYVESHILDIIVNGDNRVEASARAFLGHDSAAKQAKASVYDFADTSKNAAIPLSELANGVSVVAVKMAQTEAEARALDRAFDSIGATTSRRASTGLRSVGEAADAGRVQTNALNTTIRNLGFGVSDVFSNNGPIGSKIGGFANNVGNITTGILSMLGKTGPAALAAAAGLEIGFTVLGASLNALGVKSTSDFLNLFTGAVNKATGGLVALETRIEELTSKPHLIPVEVVELQNARKAADDLKKSLETIEKLRTGQSHYERESGKAVEQTLGEGGVDDAGKRVGGREIADRLRAGMVNELLATDSVIDEKKKYIEAAARLRTVLEAEEREQGYGGAATETIAKLEDKVKAAEHVISERQTAISIGSPDGKTPAVADTQLDKILKDAEKGAGEQQRVAREALAKRLAKVRLGGIGGGVAASSPEDIEEHETVTENLDERNKIAEDARKRREAATKAEQERARNVNADRDREMADADRDVLQAVGGDVRKDATMELAGGKTREEVRKRVTAQIRAALDEADQVRDDIRDAVAEAVGGKLVTNIQDKDVAAAKAGGETKAATAKKAADAKAAKDKKDLAEGLGEDFLAGFEVERMGLELDPNATARMKAEFQARLFKLAVIRLQAAGHSLDEATRLAGGAGGLVRDDVQQRMNQERASAGMPNAPAPMAMEAAFNRLFAQVRNADMARPKARIAPGPVKALKRRSKAGPAAASPVPGGARPAERKKPRTFTPAPPMTQNQREAADRAAPARAPGFGGPNRGKQMGPAAPDAGASLGGAMDDLAEARAGRDQTTVGLVGTLSSAVQNLAAAEMASRQRMAQAAGMANQALAMTQQLRRA